MMLYIDVDGTLADLVGPLLKALNTEAGTNWKHEDVTEPVMLSILPLGRAWHDYATAPDFWLTLPLLPWAGRLMDSVWKSGQPYAYLTALLPLPDGSRNVLDDRRRWLDKHFPGTSERLVVATRKELVVHPGDILIDDHPSTIDTVQKMGAYVLPLRQPWNPEGLSPEQVILHLLSKAQR